MPQMSPMNWLALLIFFYVAIYCSSVKFYFLSAVKISPDLSGSYDVVKMGLFF